MKNLPTKEKRVMKDDIKRGVFAAVESLTGDAVAAYRACFPESVKGKTDHQIKSEATRLLQSYDLMEARKSTLNIIGDLAPIKMRKLIQQSIDNMDSFTAHYKSAKRITRMYGQDYVEVIAKFSDEELMCMDEIEWDPETGKLLKVKFEKAVPYYQLSKQFTYDLAELAHKIDSERGLKIETAVKTAYIPKPAPKIHDTTFAEVPTKDEDTGESDIRRKDDQSWELE